MEVRTRKGRKREVEKSHRQHREVKGCERKYSDRKGKLEQKKEKS